MKNDRDSMIAFGDTLRERNQVMRKNVFSKPGTIRTIVSYTQHKKKAVNLATPTAKLPTVKMSTSKLLTSKCLCTLLINVP
jgi:hypothetical protein